MQKAVEACYGYKPMLMALTITPLLSLTSASTNAVVATEATSHKE